MNIPIAARVDDRQVALLIAVYPDELPLVLAAINERRAMDKPQESSSASRSHTDRLKDAQSWLREMEYLDRG